MIRFLRRLGGCERGAAAMEFGLIAPILIVFHLGAVEVVQAYEADRRVGHVAAAVADLTAQNRTVTTAGLDDIMLAGSLLMAPFPSSQLGERITSFTANATGTVQQDWSVTKNWTASGAPAVPTGYLAANESVIVVDVTYAHSALFGLVLTKALTMQSHAYLRPRLSTSVVKL
jgi:Flp pilus assembly protein TadG